MLKKIILILLLTFILSGCVQNEPETLRLSTTTSTCDTGLLDVLNKKFEEDNNVKILTICQGTGKAIANGELGASDVVFVHSEKDELKAVENGSFINRTYVMYNYFVILGPKNDPAGIKNSKDAKEAFRLISEKESPFVSRGDDSGTHKKELSIWKALNITTRGKWYQSVGKGMGETITTTDIKQGYTLSDRGTYIAMKDKITLELLFDSDKEFLFNPYHVMAVNPNKYPDVKYNLAIKYINFLTSKEGQEIIKNFGNSSLFIPANN